MCEINWVLLLDFIKVLLSWPPVIGLLAITFMLMFRARIEAFIDDVEEVGMGGAKLLKGQRQATLHKTEFKLPGASETESAPVAQPPAQQGEAQQPELPNRTVSQETRELMGSTADYDAAMDYMLKEPGRALDEYVEQTFIASTERAFAHIYGTQIQALEYLNNVGVPVPLSDILPFFQAHLERGKHLSEPITLEIFTSFLENTGLTKNVGTPDGPLLQITHRGKRFLAYIKQFYPAIWNTQAL
ncbi:MAG: hypothetical protein Q7K57_61505 [Burkholderiaceae bacterium]|nr:hypothetical protein [Burkholderiaceae bacterium]